MPLFSRTFKPPGFMVGGDNDEGILPSLCPVKCNLHRSSKFKRLVNIALNVVRVSSVIDFCPPQSLERNRLDSSLISLARL